MSSREQILNRVKANQPVLVAIPDLEHLENIAQPIEISLETFKKIAGNVGSQVIEVANIAEVRDYVAQKIAPGLRVVTTVPELYSVAEDAALLGDAMPHEFENVELAVLNGEFGVAENSAIWITEQQMRVRVLPFIAQHLALLINASDIVTDMHAAYQRIDTSDHGFATFIAGPSKTADIEQSLVLGAHGARSLVIFILQDLK